jgi:hypothetical protein
MVENEKFQCWRLGGEEWLTGFICMERVHVLEIKKRGKAHKGQIEQKKLGKLRR